VPVLELDDGRVLGETRAICTYLEGLAPLPNLMGSDFEERAFIEMADRRVELYLFGGIANWIRHTHPGLAPLEQPQFPDFGRSQGEKVRDVARWLDANSNSPITPSLPANASPSPTSPPSVPSNLRAA
jgi:glutathione S-transferase